MSKITIKNNMWISKKWTEGTYPRAEVRIHDSLKWNLKQETWVPKITMNFPGKISKVMNINTLKIQKMEERLREYQELADKFCEWNLAILLWWDSQLSQEPNYDFYFTSHSFNEQFRRRTKCNNKNWVMTWGAQRIWNTIQC